MDRFSGTNQAPDIGGGRRGFRDRNLGLGQAGSVLNALFLNGAQEEIVRAIERSGQAPSDADREQLARAIRRAAGANMRVVTANTVLTVDDAGLVIVFASAGPITITLPTSNAAAGASIPLVFARTDGTANSVSIQRSGADNIEGAATIGLLAGDRLAMRSDGAQAWLYESGNWGARSLGVNGWQRLPSGLILQWGTVTFGVAGGTALQQSVFFPLTFPTEVFGVTANGSFPWSFSNGHNPICAVHLLNAASFALRIDNNTGSQANAITQTETMSVRWQAIGR